ncbi:MAG: DUF192 domain-containing protein [bacterium]
MVVRLCFAVTFLLAACGDRLAADPRPAPASVPSDAAAPPAPACQTDRDCTGDWTPDQRGCDTPNRCFGGQCIPPPAMTGEANDQTGQIVFEGAPEVTYQVEVAAAPFETQRGLMCRPSMKADWGMVFLLASTRVQRFWMFNTLIPLDMIFLDEDWNVVGVVENAEPLTLSGRGVNTPSRYVLELSVGQARRAGITVGRKARFYPPRSGL